MARRLASEATPRMTADGRWSHLPEPLRALLRELRARASDRVRARMAEVRREFPARRWGEATTPPSPDAGSKSGQEQGEVP